jgi:hypothetical protein
VARNRIACWARRRRQRRRNPETTQYRDIWTRQREKRPACLRVLGREVFLWRTAGPRNTSQCTHAFFRRSNDAWAPVGKEAIIAIDWWRPRMLLRELAGPHALFSEFIRKTTCRRHWGSVFQIETMSNLCERSKKPNFQNGGGGTRKSPEEAPSPGFVLHDFAFYFPSARNTSRTRHLSESRFMGV